MALKIGRFIDNGNVAGGLTIGLLLRLGMWMLLYFNLGLHKIDSPYLGVFFKDGDSAQYILMAENFVHKDIYAEDVANTETYTSRMPGLALPYIVYRQFLSPNDAVNAVFILQMILSVLALYAGGQIGFILTQSRVGYWIATILLSVFAYLSVFDFYFLTESFTLSCLLLASFSIIVFYQNLQLHKKSKYNFYVLFAAGLFACWAVFLRPITFLFWVIIVFCFCIIWIQQKNIRRKIAMAVCIFAIPFGLIESMWVARNYMHTGDIVLIQNSRYAGVAPPKSYQALLQLIKAWGEDEVYWQPHAAMGFFYYPGREISHLPELNKLPEHVYCSAYNSDSLTIVRNNLQSVFDTSFSLDERQKRDTETALTIDKYLASYKKERPAQYYFWAPLRLLKIVVLQPGTYYISNQSWDAEDGWGKAFKLFQVVVYVGVLLLCIVGVLLWRALKIRLPIFWLGILFFTAIYLIAITWVWGFTEYRYIVLVLPFWTLHAAIVLTALLEKSNKLAFFR